MIAGKPLLGHQLDVLKNNGVTSALILVSYGATAISDFVGTGERWDIAIRCVADTIPQGTAGAVMAARAMLDREFLLLNGDTIFDVDVRRLIEAHHAADADATLLLHPNDHPHDSDLVEVDHSGRIRAFHPYPHPEGVDLPNLVNAGLYYMRRDIMESFEHKLNIKPDFGKHVFPALLQQNVVLFGYRSPEYIKDAGTPERHRRVEADLLSGRVAHKSLRAPCPAIFLDRDGTLNEEINRVKHPDEFRLIAGVSGALARLNDSDFRTVVVTNQGVIARGECDEKTLAAIHRRMDSLLGREGAYVDALYYCPHLPDSGFAGERMELKLDCECRKPKTGLIDRAARDLNIDISGSWMIGDSTSDIALARACRMKTILLRTGHAGLDAKFRIQPDFECRDLADAVALILDLWPRLWMSVQRAAAVLVPGATVLVGGQAHAGKSSWASALRLALSESGHDAVVIPADSWLRSAEERHGRTVFDRYDIRELERFVAEARMRSGHYRIARYDRRTRRPIPNAIELSIKATTTIIVEGVPVLASQALRKIANTAWFVERNETDRIKTFNSDYQARGWTPAEIDRVLKSRLAEELPRVEATREHAKIISL